MVRRRLGDFCQARSGDKADVANIALFAPTSGSYDLIREQVTEERVTELLAPLVHGAVVRYEVPNLLALNFVCTRALGGGGPRTLRSDVLGKTFGPNLLRLPVDVPDEMIDELPVLEPPRPSTERPSG
jgi:hypothetical protein